MDQFSREAFCVLQTRLDEQDMIAEPRQDGGRSRPGDTTAGDDCVIIHMLKRVHSSLTCRK